MAKRLSRHRGTTPRIGLPVALTLLLLVLLAAVFAKPALVIADETAPEEIEATATSDDQPNEESADNVQLDLDETSVDAEETALDETATNE
ncbi:MAG: hypothetical protein IJM67_09045 [Atopobiaceae bacterium]|nr:hypothetical protein [Atopobiaceae bacterium]